MGPAFGTDGIRGLANAEVSPDVALALGRAAVEISGQDHLVIGRDTRRSGPMLEAALVAGATSAGATVELLGVVPTPAVAWAAAARSVPGAMISASHNPFADNGIKLFAAGGLKLRDEEEERIETRFHDLLAGRVDWTGPVGAGVGTVVALPADEAAAGWIGSVCGSVADGALAGLSLVLDCANGAAHRAAPEVFRRLGAEVQVIGAEPDGCNINDSCGSNDPGPLSKAVIATGADAGLAFDGDADRLIAVDETGSVVDGDRVLAVLAIDWAAQGRLRDRAVVVTVMTNLGFHRAMAGADIDVIATAVGDRYVLEVLDERRLSLGGEQSGHVICRDLATTGDGVLTGVQLLDVVRRSGASLSELAGGVMSTVPQLLRNVRLPRRDDTLLERLSGPVEATESSFGDDGRVLVRMSGTEPLLRIMVEHIDPTIAESACERLVAAAQELVSGV